MENGIEIADAANVAEVKTVEEVFFVSKVEDKEVSGLQGSQDSKGDDVFEEMVDEDSDNRNDAHETKADSDDVVMSMSADVETVRDSGSSGLDGNLSVGNEGEIVEDALEVPAQGESQEQERDRNLSVGNDGEIIEDALGVSALEESREQESVEKEDNSLEGESLEEVLVANVDDRECTINDVNLVLLNDGEVIDVDDSLACRDDNGVIEDAVTVELEEAGVCVQEKKGESEVLKPPEREASMDVEEKSGQVLVDREKSDNGDSELMGVDDLGACETIEFGGPLLHRDEKIIGSKIPNSTMDDNNVNEMSGKPRDALVGISSHDQTNDGVDLKEASVGAEKDDGSIELKPVFVSFSLDQQNNNTVTSENVSGSNVTKSQVGKSKESGDDVAFPALLPDQQEGGSKLDGNVSGANSSVESMTLTFDCKTASHDSGIERNDKYEIDTDELGTDDYNSFDQSRPTGEDVDDIHNNRVVEEQVTKTETSDKAKQNGQAGREIEMHRAAAAHSSSERSANPAAAANSLSGRSANPTLPSARPAGLGRAAPLMEPAPRVMQQPRLNGAASQVQSQLVEEAANGDVEEGDESREKLQMIRVKFLRLAHRLGQTPHNVVVAQVLYRLGLAEQLRGRNGGRVSTISFDRASAMAEQLEATGLNPLDFSCTILVLGKTGVGKSATINSIFDEVKFRTDAFHLGTHRVQDVVGTVQGIMVRVIDTPGLLPSSSDQRKNEKTLHSVKRFIKKTPPDIVLYLDRLDMQSRDFGDAPLLRTITEIFGPSIWFNAIVVLTHAASAPPEGPNGTASTYDTFVTQRSHAVQQAIRQAAGDMRLMNPVSLVENHSACRTNRAGQRVLPNGQVWKPHLLLLSFASKILAEANTLLKLQDTLPGKPFATRLRSPILPGLLSSLLQSRPQLKLPGEQFGDDNILDDDLDETSDSDDELDYDELPPFRSLTKAQLAKLTKAQRKAYYDELEYREKLLLKKELKKFRRSQQMKKKKAEASEEVPADYGENVEDESGGPSVSVPMPDLTLPASFDSDYPSHRYRYLNNSNQWQVRPVLYTSGWDHDVGYDGINIERLIIIKEKVPLSISGQVSQDKKDANLQLEVAGSIEHGKGRSTTLRFDMQSDGKDKLITLRSDMRFSNHRHNKAIAGLSVTLLGDGLTAGMKFEDQLNINKRFRLVMSGGAITGRDDVAFGGSLDATLRDKDHPLGRSLSSFGLSIMNFHGGVAIGCNVQSQIPVGRFTNLVATANLNNRRVGKISVRVNSSEQLQLALVGFIPLIRNFVGLSQQHSSGY
ncbi:hypothetical protein Nepgr_015381 [Nepenthes gracilis]|uniref:AIG1-type G domain-containing protein n=1 Tax=Nepenthes gracilis TaxID=150966 RepID=A0AAD3SMS9_NEPGR|nr:hypothetical protein Nepgr_015381 [Nepenthes gracilis]